MSRRYKSLTTDTLSAPNGAVSLPMDKPVAAYYRQSTLAQVGNISTSMQTIDLPEYLKRLGWSQDKIILIDMDQGVSGTTKIDERNGMQMLFELITEGTIGALACQDEDRLFRDVTQIQVNIFIEACRAAHVLVITPSMVYDFANELTGTFHACQFRFKSEMAAEYLDSVIRGKLYKAKRRLLMEGRWAGAAMPTGFMVDMRKTLLDGTKNENWRRFVPFEPYAQVVREYFQLYLTHAGHLRSTVRHIQEHGPYYPDPGLCKPPEGFKVVYHLHRYGKGYCPGRTGLQEILTNAAFIGHWTVNDVVVRWNNHPAIVPEDIFIRAFNYRSAVTLRGTPNPHYRPVQEHARPSCEQDRQVERPLCSGMIVSQYNGEWKNVGTDWVRAMQHYVYILRITNPYNDYVWSKAATYIDDAVVTLLHKKLQGTFDPTTWDQTLAEPARNHEAARKNKQAQIDSLKVVLENQITSLDTLTDPDLIRGVETRYKEGKAELARLTNELAVIENDTRLLDVLRLLEKSYSPAVENWSSITRDEKRSVLHAFIQQIEAAPMDGQALHLAVRWRDGSFDEIILPWQFTEGSHWLPSETKRLLELIENEASQIEIAREFPERRWSAIRERAQRSGRALKTRPKPIKDNETYQDYCARVGIDSLVDMISDAGSGTGHPNPTAISAMR